MKKLFLLPLWALLAMMAACSEETGTVDPYQDWEARNQHYLDSIALVAKNNPSEWMSIHTFKYPESVGVQSPVTDYVYVHVKERGHGLICENYNDTVEVHYRGKLIPLYNGTEVVFDQNYAGELNLRTNVASVFTANKLITGWSTALMAMREGDSWTIYVPYTMGYGADGDGNSIPGYSTLVFDMYLSKVRPLRPTGK